MTVEEAADIFSSYAAAEKGEFLALLMYEMTVIARESYEVGGEGLTDPRRVRLLNEVQHRVSSFLSALLRQDPRRCDDATLVRIILEQPGDESLGRQLGEAFARLAAQRLAAA